MAATERSSGSSVLCTLNSSPCILNHHHYQTSSASPCNIHLSLKKRYPRNSPKSSAASLAVWNLKRKCLCSPTTHPGSFRCSFHRRLEKEKIGTLKSSPKRNRCGNSRLNLRKTALMNSLAKIGSVEAERFRKKLAATIVKVKPSSFKHSIRRWIVSRPRPSRFSTLHKDQD